MPVDGRRGPEKWRMGKEVAGESAWVTRSPARSSCRCRFDRRLRSHGFYLSFGLTTAHSLYAERRRKKRPVQDRP
jgi:hypothetical protein